MVGMYSPGSKFVWDGNGWAPVERYGWAIASTCLALMAGLLDLFLLWALLDAVPSSCTEVDIEAGFGCDAGGPLYQISQGHPIGTVIESWGFLLLVYTVPLLVAATTYVAGLSAMRHPGLASLLLLFAVFPFGCGFGLYWFFQAPATLPAVVTAFVAWRGRYRPPGRGAMMGDLRWDGRRWRPLPAGSASEPPTQSWPSVPE